MASQKGHHDICIFKAGNGYRVRPAAWSTNGARTSGNNPPEVTFRNLTDEDVLLVLPPDMLDPSQSTSVSIGPKRQTAGSTLTDTATVQLAAKGRGELPGVYPYSVIVIANAGAVYASGESEPVVIIDPPPN